MMVVKGGGLLSRSSCLVSCVFVPLARRLPAEGGDSEMGGDGVGVGEDRLIKHGFLTVVIELHSGAKCSSSSPRPPHPPPAAGESKEAQVMAVPQPDGGGKLRWSRSDTWHILGIYRLLARSLGSM
ncbi:hypothetical protein Tco_1112426 [Tanacetum coccineum]|uniref:Uncharacterized protein n=1 Tax=Tanacetum coccineum TaxID=301880 RepID=A0ABQ5ISA5_9ASTR